jgi:hypothetical protein
MAGEVGGLGVEVEIVERQSGELRAPHAGIEKDADSRTSSNASPSQAASRPAISSPVKTCGSGSLAARARIDAIGEVASSFSATSHAKKRDRAW